MSSWLSSDYDQATGAFPDTPSHSTRIFSQVWSRLGVDTFDGALTHSLNVFANRTDRLFNDVTYRINTLPRNTTSTITEFIGDRLGAEYQGVVRSECPLVTYGAKAEHETADTAMQALLPVPGPRVPTLGGVQDSRALFALCSRSTTG